MQLVLFDFDGVIADSWEITLGMSRSYNPDLTEEHCRRWFEGNINGRLDEETDVVKRESRKKAEAEFHGRYSTLLMERPPFRGIDIAIRNLASRYTLVIVSSTVSDVIDQFLSKQGIRECFQDIYGNDVHTSKVKKIGMALEKYAVAPSDAIMVTDTLGDIREARTAGVVAVAVTWGFHERERLMKGEPVALVDSADTLAATIDVYFQKA